MTEPSRYDLVVLGAGPAGEKGAAQAAYFGKRVAVVEREPEVGGACVNTGTIPSKTLRETALYFSGLRQRGLYGIDYSLREGLTVRDFMHRLRQVQRSEWQLIRHNLFRHRIDLYQGDARFVGTNEIEVRKADGSAQRLGADVVLIATGSVPHRPPGIPFDGRNVFDSDTILAMDHLPRTLVVVGAGVIGCEYASIFAALGIGVTLVDGRERPLPFVDSEIVGLLLDRLRALGVETVMPDEVVSVSVEGEDVTLTLGGGRSLSADSVLFAAGRGGATAGLGLEAVGVRVGSRGHVVVDERFRTSLPHVLAAGDVIGFPALASTSMEQARVAVCHAFGFGYKEHVSPVLPYGIYTIPEVSMVGETEDTCRAKGIDHVVGRASYLNNARAQILGDTQGLVKLVFARDKRLLGVHIIGESASELVHLGMDVLNRGATIDAFIQAVYNFPTLGELYKYAAYDGLGNLARLT